MDNLMNVVSNSSTQNAIEGQVMTVAEAQANLNAVILNKKSTKKQLEDAVMALQEAQAREAAVEPDKGEEAVDWTNKRTGEVFSFTGIAAKLVNRNGDITWSEVADYVREMQAKFGKDKKNIDHCVRVNKNGKTFFSYNEHGCWYVNIFHPELKKGMELQRALALLRGTKFNALPTRNPATGEAQLNFSKAINFQAGERHDTSELTF